jgi:hypothetical protein
VAQRVVYRDRETGRWVKESTWRRSKAHGGTRYKREFIRLKVAPKLPEKPPPKPPKKPPRKPPKAAPPLPAPVFEWIVSFTYTDSGRSFDVLVTARNIGQARKTAIDFLRDDPEGRKIVRAGLAGWKVRTARGKESSEEPGEAEYRDTSKNETEPPVEPEERA